MSGKYLLIANWKLHHSQRTARVWLHSFIDLYTPLDGIDVAIAPSFSELFYVRQELDTMQLQNISLVSQSVSQYEMGKYTGEVGAFQLSDIGVDIGLVGHSERRNYLHEGFDVVASQVKQLLNQKITPLIAVSDISQVTDLKKQTDFSIDTCMWAYEPLDAIGSGNAADPVKVDAFLAELRNIVGQEAVCLYGGSVDAQSVSQYMDLASVNGFLVGTASIDVVKFVELHQQIKEAYEKA